MIQKSFDTKAFVTSVIQGYKEMNKVGATLNSHWGPQPVHQIVSQEGPWVFHTYITMLQASVSLSMENISFIRHTLGICLESLY